MNAGFAGTALTLAMASRNVPSAFGRLVEADVAVANLKEGEGWSLGGEHLLEQAQGFRHAAGYGPQHAGASPHHAFERASAGNSRFSDFGSGFSLRYLVFAHRNLLKWRSSVVRRPVRPLVYSPRL
jgi:hypothetical protein